MTRELNVYLHGEKAGVLYEDQMGYLSFRYDPAALRPLSVRMPVRDEQYDRFYAEPFFDNLAPEGEALEIIAGKFRVSEDNIFSILDKIGGDCAGAVSLYGGDMPHSADLPPQIIDDNTIAKIIDQLPENPLLTGIDNAPRLSLAGAQSKFAVFRSYSDNKTYYRSDDNHPTTHIIKIANKRFPDILENELFCMKLAGLCLGGNVKPGTISVDMRIAAGHKYLEIERYDRRINTDKDTNGKTGTGVSVQHSAQRIHQEDFCQALGYLARRKYQADGGPGIRDLHNAILEYSSQKAVDSYRFIELLTFNYLIGNADAHAKNFSLLHANGSGHIVLAPAYDLLSVEVYPQKSVSHEIAMLINGKGRYDKVTQSDWLALYKQLGLNPASTLREMNRNYQNIVSTAKSLRDELNQSDLTESEIYDSIIAVIEKRYATIVD